MSMKPSRRNLLWGLGGVCVSLAIATFFLAGETDSADQPDNPVEHFVELPLEEQPQNPPEESVHHSNGSRFVFTKRYYIDSDLPADTLLEIFHGDAERPVERLVIDSWYVDVIKDDLLSKDLVLLREWSGGASCCWIIHAFQTKPGFKRLLTHNNDHFKPEEFIVGKDTLELYDPDSDKYSDPRRSHASLVYEPIHFDMRNERWLPVFPGIGDKE
jgi:hypothetical protein